MDITELTYESKTLYHNPKLMIKKDCPDTICIKTEVDVKEKGIRKYRLYRLSHHMQKYCSNVIDNSNQSTSFL